MGRPAKHSVDFKARVVLSVLLNLFVLPSLYLRDGRSRSAQRARRGTALPATAVLAVVVAALALLASG